MARPVVTSRNSPVPRRPGGSPPPRRRSSLLIRRAVLVLIALCVLTVGWSIGNALTAPGGGTFAERMAEWARGHYLGPLVTFGEWLTYSPPPKGGKPSGQFNSGGTVVKLKKEKHYYLNVTPIIPPPIGSPAGAPMPGEGQWRMIESVGGSPAIFKTWVRESVTYSGQVAGIVSMDPRLVSFGLRPGVIDPGYANWNVPYYVPAGRRQGLLATYNGGFKLDSARGGFYLNGVRKGALVKGSASEVFYKDGRVTVGSWGYGGLAMTPRVAGVRQNLKLIVIGGRVPSSVDRNVTSTWGATIGGAYYVWRSGVGVTKDGRVIYVYGPGLDVRTLADLLKRAGSVNAMMLDINPDWTAFTYYDGSKHPVNPVPHNLLPGQYQSAYRYFSTSGRDFTVVYAR